MAEVLLGLGSNLGDKAANLAEAVQRLQPSGRVLATSSVWRTAPVGFLNQDWFLNAAVALDTDWQPLELLAHLLHIEKAMGRIRTQKNGPRLIDLDILLWDQRILDEPELQVPHPRMHERLFVLAPLHEIRPLAWHPLFNCTVEALYHRVAEQEGVLLHGPFPGAG